MEKYFENPDGWYEAAEELEETNELLAFFKTTFNSPPFPSDFAESAGVMDKLFELLDNLEKENRYDDFKELYLIVRDKQLQFYQQDGIYLVEGLLKHSLAKNNIEEAKSLFDDILNTNAPTKNVDIFLEMLKTISWYNGTEKWVSDIIHKVFEPIKNDSSIMETANMDLSEYLFAYQMQIAYQEFLEKGTVDINPYLDYLRAFDYEFDSETKQMFQKWLSSPLDLQELKGYFASNPRYFNSMLITYFSKYMFDTKQVGFLVAGNIASKMFQFWYNKKQKISSFELAENKFDGFLSKHVSFMSADHASIFGGAVGSIYMYDFLKNIDFINEKTYENATSGIAAVLKMLLKMNKITIYRNSFFKFWEKPNTDKKEALQELISLV
ncbi:MAG: hypothetical protein U5M51_02325 [Emticicia sp.]|nr:hypothetical protein [Emticicia sp.]